MYFRRNLSNPEIAVDGNVLRDTLRPLFNVTGRVHPSRRDALAREITETSIRTRMADEAAAAFTAAYETGIINNSIIAKLIELCHATVTTFGFAVSSYQAFPARDLDKECTLLVAGCQHRPIIERRVAATKSLVNKLGRPVNIIFSGKHSATEKVQIRSEGEEMQAMYESMGGKTHGVTFLRVKKELEATRTLENIDNVLQAKGLISRDQQTCLVVVSSTFHLPRIARELDSLINEDRFNVSSFITDICLVGAEEPSDAKAYVPGDWASMKALMFELYNIHIF